MSGLPSNPLPSFVKRNPHVYAGAASQQPKARLPVSDAPRPARIRQSSKPLLNKLEQRYLGHLKAAACLRTEVPEELHWIGAQCFTLRLANGCKYTPDFWTFNDDGKLQAMELKGPHTWEDSIVKLKIAASLYPMFEFYLVRWDRDKCAWVEKLVKA